MTGKLRQRAARAAAVGAVVASTLTLASAPDAMAAPYNGWSTTIGPNGSGCFAYTTYTSNIVTPHIWQQAGNTNDRCFMHVFHVGYDSGGFTQYSNRWPESGENWTSGASTVLDGPSWYYGPWTSGDMCVWIEVGDQNGSSATNGYQGRVCPW